MFETETANCVNKIDWTWSCNYQARVGAQLFAFIFKTDEGGGVGGGEGRGGALVIIFPYFHCYLGRAVIQFVHSVCPSAGEIFRVKKIGNRLTIGTW